MLNAMRSGARSWVVKIFLGLLVLSFALWGVGDIFLGGGNQAEVADVDGKPVSTRELNGAFQQQLNQVSQMGAAISREQAISLGLLDQALNGLILEKMVERHAEDLGLAVATSEAVNAIRDDPAFGGGRRFDAQQFELFLRSNGLSEEMLLNSVRGDLMRTRLLQAFAGQISAPEILATTLAQYRGEERSGRLLVVDPSVIEVTPPSDAELEAYREANIEQFTAPEYRSVGLIILDEAELAAGIEVDEQQIIDVYEERIALYTTPKSRRVSQLVASDQETLMQAIEQLAKGQDLDAVVDEMASGTLTADELGPVTEGEMPEPFNTALWQAGGDQYGEPVESAFGWSSFRLIEEIDASTAPLEEKRDEIRQSLKRDEANRLLPELASALDDEIGAGETLAKAADRLQLTFHSLDAVDRFGNDRTGVPIIMPRLSPDMLATIFSSEADQISLMETADDDRQYVFNVSAMIEPRPRAVEDIRDQLAAGVVAEKQRTQARTIAQDLLSEVNDAGTIDGLDARDGVSIAAFGPLRRSARGTEPGFNADGIELLFATSTGEIAQEVVDVPQGVAVLTVSEIAPASDTDRETVTAQLQQQLQTDLLNQYSTALQDIYPSDINESAMQFIRNPPDYPMTQHQQPM